MPKFFLRTKSIALLILLLLVTSCSTIKSFQPTQIPIAIPEPASTPTPLPTRAILIAPNDADPNLVSEAQKILTDLTLTSGLVFETRSQITTSEITQDVKILVFLSHPENLGALSNAVPHTQFAVISDLNWNPSGNVTIIRKRLEYIAFIAGFISVNLDTNFRGGALISANDTISQDAFANGGYYFCGLCASTIQPYGKYPYLASQAEGSAAAAWQAAYDQINVNKINVLYVAPQAYSPELFTYLAGKEIILFGSQTPPGEARPRWAVTLQVDGISPLREIWPDLLAGKGGRIVYGGVRFADVQPALLPQGKLDYFQKLVDRLRAGLINPLSVSAE